MTYYEQAPQQQPEYPQYGQQSPTPAVSSPRNRRRQWLLFGLLGLLLCCGGTMLAGGLLSAVGNGEQSESSSEPSRELVEESVEEESAAEAEEEEPEPEPEPEPEWVEVIEVSGSTSSSSEPFAFEGEQQRLSWSCEDTSGFGAVVFAVYVFPAGHDFRSDGGFPEIMASEPGSDATTLYRDAGDYYVHIEAANCNWTVTIEELR